MLPVDDSKRPRWISRFSLEDWDSIDQSVADGCFQNDPDRPRIEISVFNAFAG